jgi:hypothetical protein
MSPPPVVFSYSRGVHKLNLPMHNGAADCELYLGRCGYFRDGWQMWMGPSPLLHLLVVGPEQQVEAVCCYDKLSSEHCTTRTVCQQTWMLGMTRRSAW